MTPMFSLTDKLESFEAKLKLFCGELGITLAELDGDSRFLKGIGPDPHPIILKPIVAGPDISVSLVNPADHLGEPGTAVPGEGKGQPGPPGELWGGQCSVGETEGCIPSCLRSDC